MAADRGVLSDALECSEALFASLKRTSFDPCKYLVNRTGA